MKITDIDMSKQEFIFAAINILANRLQTLGDRIDPDITSKQWFMLVAIAHFKNTTPNIGDIATALGTSRQNVKKMANILERHGVLRMEKDKNDLRVIQLFLTERCFEYFQSRAHLELEYMSGLFAGIDEQLLEGLDIGIRKLLENTELLLNEDGDDNELALIKPASTGSNQKILVTYKSQYGTTKQYATWVAEALGADLLELSVAKSVDLSTYDLVIHGGGLYAGGIDGIKTILKKAHKKLVVFTVGLADPMTTDYTEILKMGFSEQQLSKIKVFHFRGGINYNNLSFLHKGMMAARYKYFKTRNPAELSEEDKEFMATHGKAVDFVDKGSIQKLVDYVRSEK